MDGIEGFGGLFGDPEELQRRMAEFAEQMQGQQRLAWADNAIKLAVDMTVAAINRINVQGNAEQQAQEIRSLMASIFPEAVTLVREAREGLQ
jgi:CHASE3 domain sensor protein